MKPLLHVLYALFAYALGMASFGYLEGWLLGRYVPTSVDGPARAALPVALLVNLALIAVFAVQHSVMARPSFKRAWAQIVPEQIERSTYVLFSALAMGLFFLFWQPMPQPLWHVTGLGATALWSVHALGWIILLSATFVIDHFDLFGLRQVAFAARKAPYQPLPFRVRLYYRAVRHPLYVGWILLLWASPTMTLGHLLFALGLTGYILAAIPFEERDLVAALGDDYADYKRRVPGLLPFRRRKLPLDYGDFPGASDLGVRIKETTSVTIVSGITNESIAPRTEGTAGLSVATSTR